MKKLSFIIILLLTVGLLDAKAQESYVSVEYSVGVPFMDLNDYTSEISFRGLAVEYRSLLTPNVGIGFDAGWNVFYEEKGFSTFTDGTESLSGYQYRYSNDIPLLLAGSYYFMPEYTINPYASVGVGTVYSKRDTDLGSVRFTNDTWHFALKPEVGVIYQFNEKLGAKLSAKYYQMFSNDDFDNQSYLSVNLGIVLRKL